MENEEEIVVVEKPEQKPDEGGDEGEETVEELRERLTTETKAREKAEEIANNQRIRAEKAEGKAKEAPVKPSTEKKSDLSSKDLYALMDAKVPQEDVDDVAEYAALKKITVTEALKSNVVKSILADKAEIRRTADATHTGAARRTTSQASDEVLLDKARKGEMPDSDEALERLILARKGGK